MQSLRRTLEDHDLGHLRILAELWEFELPAGSARQAAAALAQAMLSPGAAQETAASLPPPAGEALAHLLAHGGRAPLADLARVFGPLTQMGPGRRDREKPWRRPQAALDALYFRGLLALAFADTANGPQEFAFVPQDLLEHLPRQSRPPAYFPPAGFASKPVRAHTAGFAAVDDATTLLAALRRRPSRGQELPGARKAALSAFLRQPESIDLLLALLLEQGMVRPPQLRPDPQATRQFLELPPIRALQQLAAAWLESRVWNDLARTPGLTAGSGSWPNDPLVTRSAALLLLHDLPTDTWWDLSAFLEGVHQERAAFQRPAGDFDSWYLQDALTGRPLTGFAHWDSVEGRLLRFLIEGPLAWLGVLDLGLDEAGVVAFRRTHASGMLLGESAAAESTLPTLKPDAAKVDPDGWVQVPLSLPMPQRYQIARVAAWIRFGPEGYVFRVSPSALAAARTQGLTVSHVRAILEHASGNSLPPGLAAAMSRWERRSGEGRVEAALLLETSDARTLRELKSHRATARFLGESVGPTAVRVRPRDVEALLAAAVRMGLLLEPPTTGESP